MTKTYSEIMSDVWEQGHPKARAALARHRQAVFSFTAVCLEQLRQELKKEVERDAETHS